MTHDVTDYMQTTQRVEAEALLDASYTITANRNNLLASGSPVHTQKTPTRFL